MILMYWRDYRTEFHLAQTYEISEVEIAEHICMLAERGRNRQACLKAFDIVAADGNIQFQFKAGGLNFHSSSYEWLVAAGNKAQFKGEGTINGQGSYKFMITADDDKPDTFRIRIWNDNGTVYDNGSQQSLGGGSIVIHK